MQKTTKVEVSAYDLEMLFHMISTCLNIQREGQVMDWSASMINKLIKAKNKINEGR